MEFARAHPRSTLIAAIAGVGISASGKEIHPYTFANQQLWAPSTRDDPKDEQRTISGRIRAHCAARVPLVLGLALGYPAARTNPGGLELVRIDISVR